MRSSIMITGVVLAALALFAGAPATAAPGDIFKTNAKATIDIAVDGSVEAVELSEVPGEDAQRIYSDQIRQWRFEPIIEDGQPVPARAFAEMDVYVIEQEDGTLQLSLGRPAFRSPPGTPEQFELQLESGAKEPFEVVRRRIPVYPMIHAQRGVEAEVVLLVEVGPTGKVQRSGVWSAVFMNLRSERVPERGMARFVAASKSAVEQWQFTPSSMETRRMIVPFAFSMRDTDVGAWQRIHPLPETREAWVAQVMAPDADSTRQVADLNDDTNRFVLLNPPELPWM